MRKKRRPTRAVAAKDMLPQGDSPSRGRHQGPDLKHLARGQSRTKINAQEVSQKALERFDGQKARQVKVSTSTP